MIQRFKKWLRNEPDVESLKSKYEDIFSIIEEMEVSFSKGGPVTWEQLGAYEISTAERPVGYPTGINCMSYRLPDEGSSRVFYTRCVALPGEKGRFGWHWHPRSRETNTQLEGNAEHDGTILPPFSVTVFEPGSEHDYILEPGGALITRFEKVL